MANVSIKVRGVEELVKKLGKLAAVETMEKPMTQSVLTVSSALAYYPPQRPTTYVRTGSLGRMWTYKVTRTGNGIQGKVGNRIPYGPWVQSEQFQAWMHKGHWQTDQQELEKNRNRITKFFQDAIDEEIRK